MEEEQEPGLSSSLYLFWNKHRAQLKLDALPRRDSLFQARMGAGVLDHRGRILLRSGRRILLGSGDQGGNEKQERNSRPSANPE
jgi:hypothetical protein